MTRGQTGHKLEKKLAEGCANNNNDLNISAHKHLVTLWKQQTYNFKVYHGGQMNN